MILFQCVKCERKAFSRDMFGGNWEGRLRWTYWCRSCIGRVMAAEASGALAAAGLAPVSLGDRTWEDYVAAARQLRAAARALRHRVEGYPDGPLRRDPDGRLRRTTHSELLLWAARACVITAREVRQQRSQDLKAARPAGRVGPDNRKATPVGRGGRKKR